LQRNSSKEGAGKVNKEKKRKRLESKNKQQERSTYNRDKQQETTRASTPQYDSSKRGTVIVYARATREKWSAQKLKQPKGTRKGIP
jgi:hypothetical protein